MEASLLFQQEPILKAHKAQQFFVTIFAQTSLETVLLGLYAMDVVGAEGPAKLPYARRRYSNFPSLC